MRGGRERGVGEETLGLVLILERLSGLGLGLFGPWPFFEAGKLGGLPAKMGAFLEAGLL